MEGPTPQAGRLTLDRNSSELFSQLPLSFYSALASVLWEIFPVQSSRMVLPITFYPFILLYYFFKYLFGCAVS